MNFNNNINDIKKINSKTYTFLSTIRPLEITKNIYSNKNVSNKYNIFLGILNYYNDFKNDILDDKYLFLDNDKSNDKSNKYKIPIKIILANACNYLPKKEIYIIENKCLQGSFKIR